jgi:lipoprotein-anchoring transpeptidase ErfK/SrfK
LTTAGVTSGRIQRPLVLLLASFAVAALATLASPAAATAAGGSAAVRASQQLVSLLRPHEARAEPSAGAASLVLVPAQTPITDERTVLPVLARHGPWLKVMLPGRPNGHTGWISRRNAALSFTAWHIVVDPARRRIVVYRNGRPLRIFSAIVGKPSTPTPAGQFFVEESIALRPGDVGAPYALALSARSNVLQEFAGGPGQIALHGLDNVGGVLGTAVSHGCVRLADSTMRWLVKRIGPGTPVTVEPARTGAAQTAPPGAQIALHRHRG